MYAGRREGDYYVFAPVSVHIANELFLGWVNSRRDKVRRAQERQRVESTFRFSPMTGTPTVVERARDMRVEMIGICLDVMSQRLPWIDRGSPQAAAVMAVLTTALARQTSAAWWLQYQDAGVLLSHAITREDEAEFERVAAPGFAPPPPPNAVMIHCPGSECGSFGVAPSVTSARCPQCQRPIVFRKCSRCSKTNTVYADVETWRCSCNTLNSLRQRIGPAPRREGFGAAFMRGFLGG